METEQYIIQNIKFIRSRITQLRLEKQVSEHRMSLDLDKSSSYIRGIVNGLSMPSVKELFRIIQYFEMSPADFSHQPTIAIVITPNSASVYGICLLNNCRK